MNLTEEQQQRLTQAAFDRLEAAKALRAAHEAARIANEDLTIAAERHEAAVERHAEVESELVRGITRQRRIPLTGGQVAA